jgi:ParB-like chromosome segregation protein Spo0J
MAAIAISATAIAAMAIAAIAVVPGYSLADPQVEAMAEDDFLEALMALENILEDQGRRARLIKKRIAKIRRQRADGVSYTDIVTENDDDPLIVQLLTESSIALDTCGADVRRAEARVLYAEGLTMEQIAERFGVTRQRVSALLQRPHERN